LIYTENMGFQMNHITLGKTNMVKYKLKMPED